MKFLKSLFKRKKKRENEPSFEQFQKLEGGYLYKTSDGDCMLFKSNDKS